jgi:hypothetical protein
LNEAGSRFRSGARGVSAEASHLGEEAARLGNDALRRLSDQAGTGRSRRRALRSKNSA